MNREIKIPKSAIIHAEKNYYVRPVKQGANLRSLDETDYYKNIKGRSDSGAWFIANGYNNWIAYLIDNPDKFPKNAVVVVKEILDEMQGETEYVYSGTVNEMKNNVMQLSDGQYPSVNQNGLPAKYLDEANKSKKELEAEIKLLNQKIVQLETDKNKAEIQLNQIMNYAGRGENPVGDPIDIFEAIRFYRQYGNGKVEQLKDEVRREGRGQMFENWGNVILDKGLQYGFNTIGSMTKNLKDQPKWYQKKVSRLMDKVDRLMGIDDDENDENDDDFIDEEKPKELE